MQKFFQKYWPGLALATVILAFFSKLFFPLSIFITPDYGRSDLLHFNIPVRTFSQEALKNWELPLWEPALGQGFPLLDEGQIGFFYLPNIVLFGILPFWLAFNLSYVTTFLIAGFGAYFLARSLGISKIGSYLAAITFAFSPIFVLQISHLNLIQAASISPWLFLLINSFFKRGNYFYLLLFPILASQQIFTGFTQIFFYSQVGVAIFFVFKLKTANFSKYQKVKSFLTFGSAIVFSLFLASVQVLATYNLTVNSDRMNEVTPQKILLDFPYTPKNLLTVFDPYILGDISRGTYPHWHAGSWGVFWESNSYFGIAQLIIVTGFIISLFFKRRSPTVIFWVALGGLSLLLALGPYAPLHPLFSFPPFSYFRVPARFLMLFFLSMALVAGWAIAKIPTKTTLGKFVMLTLALAATLDIFRVWYNYQETGQIKEWLSPPLLSSIINKDYRTVNYGQNETWNEVFVQHGWTGQKESYQFFRNLLAQNPNSDFNISNLFVYAGMYPKRTKHLATLATIDIKNEDDTLKIGKISQKILNFSSTQWMTTSHPIDSASWKLVEKLKSDDKTIYLFKNLEAMPHAFLVNDWQTTTTIPGVIRILNSDFDPAKSVILEKDINLTKSQSAQEGKAEVQNYQKTRVDIKTETKQDSILVLSDSFYPGWEATIDGQKTQILAANINSRAVLTPTGNHLITFSYKPELIFWGLLITIVAHFAYIAFLAKQLLNRHPKLPLA